MMYTYKPAKTILSKDNGANLYRGCTHGCIYCDSRSLCYHNPEPFENIVVKENSLELLDKELSKKKTKVMISTGSMSDPYMGIEDELQKTRGMLELVLKYGHGVHLITKSEKILRDLDLLVAINKQARVVISMTITTMDDDITKIIEPNVSNTAKRIATLKTLSDSGIDVGVWISPILPFINDNIINIMGIIDALCFVKAKYIVCFGMGLTLREGNREYFYKKIDEYFPGLKQIYQKTYGNSYMINSPNNKELMDILISSCEKNNIIWKTDEAFRFMKYMR